MCCDETAEYMYSVCDGCMPEMLAAGNFEDCRAHMQQSARYSSYFTLNSPNLNEICKTY